MRNIKTDKKIKNLIALDRKIEKLPRLSPIEQTLLEREQNFEAVYYSNKLEGNKLSKKEAFKAISLDK